MICVRATNVAKRANVLYMVHQLNDIIDQLNTKKTYLLVLFIIYF